jgi:hypothetical protein
VPAGRHLIDFDFLYDGGGMSKEGTGTLTIDGTTVAEGRIERTIPFRAAFDDSTRLSTSVRAWARRCPRTTACRSNSPASSAG